MNLNRTHSKWNRHTISGYNLNPLILFFEHQILIVFLFLSATFSTLAQNPSYYQFNTDNGLPSNETYKTIEDNKGYIWITTDRGVARYDGYDFKIFTTEDGLSNNVNFWIYEDYKGRIWFSGVDNSLCYFENGTFTEHPASEELKRISNEIIFSIYVGRDDIVWLGSLGEKPILKLFPNGEVQSVLPTNVESLDIHVFKMNETDVIFGVHVNLSKISTQKKILIYDKNALLQSSLQIPTEPGDELLSLILSEGIIYLANGRQLYAFSDSDRHEFIHSEKRYTNSLFQDNNGNLWAGHRNGGARCIVKDNVKDFIQNFMGDWTVSSIFQDREGGFWFGTTEAGVFYYPSSYIENLGLFNKKITKIRHGGKFVWAMTADGMIYEITNKYDNYNFEEIYYEESESGLPTYVDFESNFWVSTINPFQSRRNKDVTINPKLGLSFIHMIRLQDSTVWACTRSELQRLSWPDFTLTKSINFYHQFKRVKAVKAFSSDELLLGGFSGLWTLKDGEIKRYKYHNKIFENRINDLEILSNKDIVIASLGEGIIKVDTFGRIRQITKKEGLLSGLVNCCYTLPGDSVTWVGSNSGLSQIKWLPNSPDSIEILNFTIFNGLNSNEVLSIDYVEDKLWVGTAKGITVINQDDFSSLKKQPLIHMESIYINGASIKDTSTYILSKNDFVKIHFGGISMNSKGNMSYRYRIKGFDDEWENISNRVLEFKLFTPGQYEVEISSINASGFVSSNFILREFIVLPAFWETWWFRATAILFLILLIGFIFNRRYKIKQRENYLLTRSLETEQEALSSQITPHFLFNSLNSIQNLYQSNQSKDAVLHLANFSWLMRRILQNVKLHSVLLSNELETLKLYMDLEVLRLNNNFSYSVNLDPEVDVDFVRIPPMMIQPFVENSIWHGILNKPDQNGEISINISIKGEDLMIEILDDGVGRKKAKEFKSKTPSYRKSTGLKAIKRRMEVLNEIYKTNLSFHITDLEVKMGKATGTKITINIPLDYA